MDTSNTAATSSPTRPGIAVRDGLGSSSTSTSTSSSFINGPTYALNGKIMLCTVIVLFVAVAAIIGLHSYGRWLFLNRRRRLSRHLRRLPVHQAAVAAAAPLGGLDASVLKSIPTFTFHAAGENPGDCAVCLSEFEDGETGRTLPKCGHAFHVECIDMWFQTHSNCPLCRAPVQARPEENAVSVDPAAIPSPSRDKENGNSSSDNSPVELVGISVEAPPSMEERLRSSPEDLGSGSDGANLAKSPGKPVLSMKRICSV